MDKITKWLAKLSLSRSAKLEVTYSASEFEARILEYGRDWGWVCLASQKGSTVEIALSNLENSILGPNGE